MILLFNFVHPVFDCVETFLVSDVVNDNDSMCAVVVIACNGFEPLLASSVPLLNKRFADGRICR